MTKIGEVTFRKLGTKQHILRVDIMVATDSICTVEWKGEKGTVETGTDGKGYYMIIRPKESR